MSAIVGSVISGVRWIVNSAGAIVGYRNPITDQDAAAAFGGAAGDYLGTIADEAAMLASGGVVGDVCYRTDTGTEWRCIAEPSTSASAWREAAAPAGLSAQNFYFSAAGTYIAALGPATAYGLFFTSFPNLATVTVYDNTAGSGTVLLATVTNGTGSTLTNYAVPIGTPPTYGAAATGICVVTTGVTVGYLTFGE